jgi:DNA processing protein
MAFIGHPPVPAKATLPLNWSHSTREEAAAWLRLALNPALKPAAVRALFAAFGSPAAIGAASPAEKAAVAGSEALAALAQGADAERVEATLRWLDDDANHLVALGDAEYPRLLMEIPDPPPVLHVRGDPALLNAPAFAIVGSRNATVQGARDAEEFAFALSEAGLAIVSGLATGIDAAAHRGGLRGRGSSIAILGTGPDIIYPAANKALAGALAERGCLVSEFPLHMPPLPGNFPRRNRLISGLSRGVLVIEAALRSGSLVTARFALDQNREVFAMPGSIHSALAKGCHELIRQGAKLVESAQDVLDELRGMGPAAPAAPREVAREDDPILAAMGFAPLSFDQFAGLTGLSAGALSAQISRLEIAGRIAVLGGGLFQRLRERA